MRSALEGCCCCQGLLCWGEAEFQAGQLSTSRFGRGVGGHILQWGGVGGQGDGESQLRGFNAARAGTGSVPEVSRCPAHLRDTCPPSLMGSGQHCTQAPDPTVSSHRVEASSERLEEGGECSVMPLKQELEVPSSALPSREAGKPGHRLSVKLSSGFQNSVGVIGQTPRQAVLCALC